MLKPEDLTPVVPQRHRELANDDPSHDYEPPGQRTGLNQELLARRSRSADGRLLTLLVWALVFAVLVPTMGDSEVGLRTIGLVSIGFGLWSYWSSGRSFAFDAVGIWSLSFALFFGSAIVLMPADYSDVVPGLQAAVGLGLLFQIITLGFALRSPRAIRIETSRFRPPTAGALAFAGVLAFAIGLALNSSTIFRTVSDGLIWASPVIVTLAAVTTNRPSRPKLLLVVAMLCVLVFGFWGGGGRLTILALLVSALIVFQLSAASHNRLLKLAVPFTLIPGLAIAGVVELSRRRPDRSLLTVPDDFSFGEGLYSVWSPLRLFGQIVSDWDTGLLEPQGFHTLWASLWVWLPRPLWPEKPEGWGRDLAFYFNPVAAQNAGHSEAALVPGELYWSFGAIGVVTGAVILGLCLRWIDGKWHDTTSDFHANPQPAIAIALWAVCLSGLMSLYWGGIFTFLGRVISQWIAIVLIFGAATLFDVATGARRRAD